MTVSVIRILSNLLFAASLALILSLVVITFYDDFEGVLASEEKLYPPDQEFPIGDCQSWTDVVRDFNVTSEDGAREVAVLMYHRMIDDKDLSDIHYDENGELHSTIITKSEFDKQMAFLNEKNYVSLTAKELQLFLEEKIEVPKKSIVLTFDGGFKDTAAVAYPVLKQNNLTALNFLITGTVTKANPQFDPGDVQYLSTTDLKDICDVFEFQSHTYNMHQNLINNKDFFEIKSKEEIQLDLETSIINLGGGNRSFAYPYGANNEKTIDILKESGFKMAFTTKYKNAKPREDIYQIPRKGVYHGTSIKKFKEAINFDE